MVTNFGYTLMAEQSGPKDMVTSAIQDERVGLTTDVTALRRWRSARGIGRGAMIAPKILPPEP